MSISPKQLLRNSTWTLLELAVYPVLVIVATPVFISRLGIEQYGLWTLVNTIGLGMNVFNLGMGDTNIRMIAAYRSRQNRRGIQLVFNHNFTLSVLLFLIATLTGLVLSKISVVALFYKSGDIGFANGIVFLASVSAGSKLIELTLLSVFKAFERFDISARLSLASRNSVLLAGLGSICAGGDLTMMFRITVAVNALNIALQIVVLQRTYGIVRFPAWRRLRFSAVYSGYNIWYWLQSVIGLLGFLTDKLLVARFTDVKTLGYYGIASLIGTQINNFFVAFGSFIFPRVSFKLAASDQISPLYYVVRSLIAIPGWAIITCLLLFGDVIFRLWLGVEVYAQSAYFIKLYLVFQAGMLLIIVPHHIINGSRDIRLNSLFELTIRTTHVLGMIGGYGLFGVNGILYGLIFSTFLNVPFQYFFFHRYIKAETASAAFLHILIPVCFLGGLLFSESLFFQLSLVLCLVLSCKLIYFDPARAYSGNFLSLRKLFSGLQGK